MKISTFAAIVFALSPCIAAAEYMNDWNTKNFYESVNMCRSAIIFPAASDYEKKGFSKGQGKEALRNESISMTKLFESISSDVCYCALNEYAKDKTNDEFVKNWESIAPYLETPRCKASMAESMKVLTNKEKMLSLKLN